MTYRWVTWWLVSVLCSGWLGGLCLALAVLVTGDDPADELTFQFTKPTRSEELAFPQPQAGLLGAPKPRWARGEEGVEKPWSASCLWARTARGGSRRAGGCGFSFPARSRLQALGAAVGQRERSSLRFPRRPGEPLRLCPSQPPLLPAGSWLKI